MIPSLPLVTYVIYGICLICKYFFTIELYVTDGIFWAFWVSKLYPYLKFINKATLSIHTKTPSHLMRASVFSSCEQYLFSKSLDPIRVSLRV